ncbi:MAG: HEAT repeat domain-containing protein [Bacteroidales bacterium]|nr:HEAT repeat domain-containing protein [Bacteroidales bacterium]
MQLMDSRNSKPRLKQQIESLRSSNRSAILTTIRELRKEGDVSVLPELFNLMLVQDDEEVQYEIAALLNDLKDKESVPVLVEAIANPEYREIQPLLVAACWQNGLSYSHHINTFINVLVTGGYIAAIEAFTVIEEAIGELEQVERNRLARSLKSKLTRAEEQKRPLFEELVRVIEAY